jgi:hypothetical protein
VGHVASMGKMTNLHKALVRKPEGFRPLERYRCRREDNIKILSKEIT